METTIILKNAVIRGALKKTGKVCLLGLPADPPLTGSWSKKSEKKFDLYFAF